MQAKTSKAATAQTSESAKTDAAPAQPQPTTDAVDMDYNADKYWVEGSDLLTDAEKVQMAKDLRELESRGVIEFRDGRWELAAGVEIEDTLDGPVPRSAITKKDATDGDR